MTEPETDAFIDNFKKTIRKDALAELEPVIKETKEEAVAKLLAVAEATQKTLDESITAFADDRRQWKRDAEEKLQETANKIFKTLVSDFTKRVSVLKYEQMLNILDRKIAELNKKEEELSEREEKFRVESERVSSFLLGKSDVASGDSAGLDAEESKEEAKYEEKSSADRPSIARPEEKQWIKVNVGGQIFETYVSTLTRCKTSMLAALFGEFRDKYLFKDENGAYCLDRDPRLFEQILNLLRMYGNTFLSQRHVQISKELKQELHYFGISLAPQVRRGAVPLASFRSTKHVENVLAWDMELYPQLRVEGFVQMNDAKTDVEVLQEGWYRIIARCNTYHNAQRNAALRVNNNIIAYSIKANTSGYYHKTHHFNEVMELKANDKVSIHCNEGHYSESLSSYLSVERIEDMEGVGVWKSTAVSSNYRRWNNAVKANELYQAANSEMEMRVQQPGLYRVWTRCHTYHGNGQNANIVLYNRHTAFSYCYSSRPGSQIYEAICLNDIAYFGKGDHLKVYDAGFSSANNVQYEYLAMERINKPLTVACWRSTTNVKNLRVWDVEQHYPSEKYYSLNEDKTKVTIHQYGLYRVSAMLNNRPTTCQGYVDLLLNDVTYARSRSGCSSTFYHSGLICEIIALDKGDQISTYCSHIHNTGVQYFCLSFEKLS